MGNPLRALRAVWAEGVAYNRARDAQRAHELNEKGRYAESGRLVERILGSAPEDGWAQRFRRDLALQPDLDRGWALFQEGREEEALEVMQALLRRFPSEPEVYLRLAPMLVQRSEFDEAAHHARCAAELASDDPHTLLRAAACVRWGDRAASRRYLEGVKVLIARAEWRDEFLFGSELVHLEGLLAFDEGREDDGLAHLERAFAMEPQLVGLAGDLAVSYLESGRPHDALHILAQGLEHHPGNHRLLTLQARAKADL